MSRVIKAGRARFVSADDETRDDLDADVRLKQRAGLREDNDRSDLQADSLRTAIEEAKREQADEFKAAYEELIAAAQDEAAMRLEDARNEASSLLAEAKTRSEAIRQEAFESGLAEGKAQAQKNMQDTLRRAEADAKALLARAEQERLRIAEETKPEMYRLALDIAEKILKYELRENHDAYMSILSNAMDHVRTEGPVTLHVNSAEFSRYFSNQDKAKLRTTEGMVSADVTVDPSVEPGGCLIETDSGVVDASVSVQLEQIGQSLGLTEKQ